MEVALNYYYGIIRKLSLLTGIWPFLNVKTKLFRVGLLTVTMLSVLVPQVNLLIDCATSRNLLEKNRRHFQIAYQLTCEQDLQCTFESMTSYLLTVVAAVKVYTFIVNIRKVIAVLPILRA